MTLKTIAKTEYAYINMPSLHEIFKFLDIPLLYVFKAHAFYIIALSLRLNQCFHLNRIEQRRFTVVHMAKFII